MSERKTPQEQLIEKYPELLEHAWPSVNDGWLPLLDTLCGMIEHYVKCQEKGGVVIVSDYEEPPEEGKWMNRFFFSQIKEKFAKGRFYYYGGDDYIRGLVDMAEAITGHTCENCGNPGEEQPTGWFKTLCDPCFNDWDDIRSAKWEVEKERLLKEKREDGI